MDAIDILARVKDARAEVGKIVADLDLYALQESLNKTGFVRSLAKAESTCDAACLLLARVEGVLEVMVDSRVRLTEAATATGGVQ